MNVPQSRHAQTRPASPAGVRRRDHRVDAVAYDFRRPIQLSREHSRILQIGFDGFARQATTVFTSALRAVCQVSLSSIEQCNYAEYVDSLNSATYMTMFSAEPMPGLGVLEIPLAATMASIDHMLGGPGSADQPERPLTEIEAGVVRGLIERLLSGMRYSLAAIVALEPEIRATEYSPQFAQVSGAADVMVVAVFDLRIDADTRAMTVCLPFSGLLPYLINAASPAPVSDRERIHRARSADLLRQQFERVPIDVAVRFRQAQLAPERLRDLSPGDVIRLDHPSSAPLEVTVEDKIFAYATAGVRGHRLAALVVGTPHKETP